MRPNMFIDITIRVTNVSVLINLRVAFHAINDRRLPLAPLGYTLVRPFVMSGRAAYSSALVAPEGQQVAPEILEAHNAWIKGSKEIAGLMLMTMDPEEGQSVSSYVLKMKGYIDNLERLGHPVTLGLGVSLILIDLRKEYDGFVHNYNMHNIGKTVNELHAMLKLYEQTLPKSNAPALHVIRAAELMKKQKNAASGAGGSGIFVIELNTILNRPWIYDTGCGTHIWNTMQGLRASRKPKPEALSLYVGNGQREAVEAI
uniref:Zinc finger, CCHC-type n=1 Tax=Tanacetum cinerariifolium TaxID=118510 RepID=A0A6L2LZQ5_TANCI|nr:zinc finger, CCHC-type [Tanacetum cinerariifolium]